MHHGALGAGNCQKRQSCVHPVWARIVICQPQASLPGPSPLTRGGVKVVNHRGKVYDNRLDQKGRLSFVSPNNGEHRLCFSVEGNSLGQDFRVHVAIEQHLKEENHDHIVKREHLSGMDLRIRQLSDTLNNIKEEQSYFKARELRFFSTTESTNARSQWCSIFQILGMALVTGFNIFYLQVISCAGAVGE
jgi:hypothetical protein